MHPLRAKLTTGQNKKCAGGCRIHQLTPAGVPRARRRSSWRRNNKHRCVVRPASDADFARSAATRRLLRAPRPSPSPCDVRRKEKAKEDKAKQKAAEQKHKAELEERAWSSPIGVR